MAVNTYPLRRNWAIWEHRCDGERYQDNLNNIGEFNDIITFWKYWINMPKPSEYFYTKNENRIKLGGRQVVGFSIFEKGINPSWEDPRNINGGEWRIRKFKNFSELDDIWLEAACMLVGENFDDEFKIVGVRVVDSSNPSKNKQLYNVEVWFEDTTKHKEIEELLKGFEIENTKFYYREHATSHENK